jgi:hypothetical protein
MQPSRAPPPNNHFGTCVKQSHKTRTRSDFTILTTTSVFTRAVGIGEKQNPGARFLADAAPIRARHFLQLLALLFIQGDDVFFG